MKYFCLFQTNFEKSGFSKEDDGPKITILEDTGTSDGIPKVLFGSGINKHWIFKLIFLDAISYLSKERIKVSLTRYVQVRNKNDYTSSRSGLGPSQMRDMVATRNSY
jgi:hypothetical protein